MRKKQIFSVSFLFLGESLGFAFFFFCLCLHLDCISLYRLCAFLPIILTGRRKRLLRASIIADFYFLTVINSLCKPRFLPYSEALALGNLLSRMGVMLSVSFSIMARPWYLDTWESLGKVPRLLQRKSLNLFSLNIFTSSSFNHSKLCKFSKHKESASRRVLESLDPLVLGRPTLPSCLPMV